MDSPRPAPDIEKELTCSICTELLYQPLTLLDCLHTFCGACLKEWFTFQYTAYTTSPDRPSTDSIYTCPSCRSPVRDTRHNATVASLLEMVVAANPDKDRPEREKEEMRKKYRPGEKVLRTVEKEVGGGRSREEEEEDRRLVEEVRERSLREVVGGERRRRVRRHRSDDEGRRSESDAERRSRRRGIEHQSSIRSLISAGGMSPEDVNREIEDFARQIQEEGLLEGLDLDNIDELIANNDELSRKITEAYRRRLRRRARNEGRRPSHGSSRSGNSDASREASRPRTGRSSRSSSQVVEEDRSRPPTSSGAATHLEVHEPRRRRRTTSGSRSATVPTPVPELNRVAARSQTDLSLRTHERGRDVRPGIVDESRSTSSPIITTASPTTQSLPFRARAAAAAGGSSGLGIVPPPQPQQERRSRPTEITTALTAPTTSPPSPPIPSPSSLLPPSSSTSQPKRTRQLYPEPSLTCKRCARPHIEYELHYNCATCHAGIYNICLDCYRRGKGCLHWFGFGYGAWEKWDKLRLTNHKLETPHMLTANRYRPPRTTPGGAEGRVTLTAQDPGLRLESGTFCARCKVWSNECFWRCDVCNEGDWGFCRDCVQGGRCCSHPLLPLTYGKLDEEGVKGPVPRKRPENAVMGEQAIGPFRVLVFTNTCEVCMDGIGPGEERYHCFACEGEVCKPCYARLETEGRISAENGEKGWRRCLAGHRMAVVQFIEGKDRALRRHVLRDWVGGRRLGFEPYDVPGLQVCYWFEDGSRKERLVTLDVSATAVDPNADVGVVRSRWTDAFPPDGGSGLRAVAKWAWYPAAGAEDELLFPKGAEVREVDDVNGDWFHGVYMGAKGLFPAPYAVPL